MAQHNQLGQYGERIACQYLQSKGYQILEQNWRSSRYEIDLIAQFQECLIVVEIKTRQTDKYGSPGSFLSVQQQWHLSEAIEDFIAEKSPSFRGIRYDIVAIVSNAFGESIEHYEDAFWPDNLNVFSMHA